MKLKQVIKDLFAFFISMRRSGTTLPEPAATTFYIVALIFAQALPHRKDLLVPNSGKTAVRDEKGQIWAVRSFQTLN